MAYRDNFTGWRLYLEAEESIANSGTVSTTMTGSPTYVDGRVGKAFSLAGNTVSTASSSSWGTNGSPGTIAFWVKTTTVPVAQEVRLVANTSTNNLGVWLRPDGTIVYRYKNAGTQSTVAINDGEWHFIVGSGGTSGWSTKVYVDGVNRSVSTGVANTSGGFTGSIVVGDTNFTGLIDEAALTVGGVSDLNVADWYAAAPPLVTTTLFRGWGIQLP